MKFEEIINARRSLETDRPLMQKDAIPVSEPLHRYLLKYRRSSALPIKYTDLVYYSHSNVLRDSKGKLTHWETAIFDDHQKETLYPALLSTYALLKAGDFLHPSELEVQQVDFCEFGNSVPFRVKVKACGKIDHFYIKIADASRIYGLELEELTSPHRSDFLYDNNTLVEAHIEGIPGDVFLREHLDSCADLKSLASAFVSFNERCFARLLGDMRSYNFVLTGGTSQQGISFRPIDFDQQCYEARKNLYLPQFYKENNTFVELVLAQLEATEVRAIQDVELSRIKTRIETNLPRVEELLRCMEKDELSEGYKVVILRRELNEHFRTTAFDGCASMGALVRCQLSHLVGKEIFDPV